MKSKCTTIVKVITALVLAVLMMVGSVANVVGAVIEQADFVSGIGSVISSVKKGAEIADLSDLADKADADEAPVFDDENEIVRGMKDDLADTGAKADLAETGYSDGGYVKGSWDGWKTPDDSKGHNMTNGYTVALAANTTYEFVFVAKDNDDVFKKNGVTISSSVSGYDFDKSATENAKIKTTVAGNYTFQFSAWNGTDCMRVNITFPAGTATTTWTAVGAYGTLSTSDAGFFGTAWAPTATANDMTESSSGVWTKTWSNVTLDSSTTVYYKVAKNHAWTTAHPASNATTEISAGTYDITITYTESGNTVNLTYTSVAKSTLTVGTVSNADVTATYNGTTISTGSSISNVPQGATVTVKVTPAQGKKCTAVTGTYSGGSVSATASGTSWTFAMPGADTEVTATIEAVTLKKIYFNNSYTLYGSVYAYVYDLDGTTQTYKYLGSRPGTTMTKLDNSNIWYIEVPADVDYVEFISGEGYTTDALTIPWTTYTYPKYTAPYGNNEHPNETNGGTWGNYIYGSDNKRTNEYTVSDGTTMSAGNLFTGLTATLYDYYTDGEITNNAGTATDTTTSSGWIDGIASNEYSQGTTGSGWNWNPYTTLNYALSAYANNSSQPKYNVTTPLYFGNLNTKSMGDGHKAVVEAYHNWNLNANNSIDLDPNSTAITGLSGKTLANDTIHYYSASDTANQNGAPMAMFDEDFLSGENNQNKALATILRTSSFPVRKTVENGTLTGVNKLYLNPAQWANDDCVFDAYFWGPNNTSWVAFPDSGNKRAVDIPSWATGVVFVRRLSSTGHKEDWDPKERQSEDITLSKTGTGAKNVYTFDNNWNNTKSNFTASLDTSLDGCTFTGGHDYYEFDSTDGKDNAYITNIEKTDKTANIDYYFDDAVWSGGTSNNTRGFFPFDYAHKGNVAHDLGFGMKLTIPFTLKGNDTSNGVNTDGTDQEFRFSGDDDLWVFVDGKLVLDLGGAHAKTTGSINFHDKTVSADHQQAIASGVARNGSFADGFNTNENYVHTMTIYYMERGMFESNLKFGFSFHAIPNQFWIDKKIRTKDIINAGFYTNNNQSGSASNQDDTMTASEGRFISKFEASYQNESFTVEHKYGSTAAGATTPASGMQYTIDNDTNTYTTPPEGTYPIKHDLGNAFIGRFTTGQYFNLKETFGNDNKYVYTPVFSVWDQANNNQALPYPSGSSYGDNTNGYTFHFNPTTSVTTSIENTNIKARFENYMVAHTLTLKKEITNATDTTTPFTIQVMFDFENDNNYIAYPLYCDVDGVRTQLSGTGEITVMAGQVVEIEEIPENAKVKVVEVLNDTITSYRYGGITLTKGGVAQTKTDITKGITFTMGDADMTATVSNSKPSYSYSIKYNYAPYVTTYSTQSYTVSGVFTEDEMTTYLKLDSNLNPEFQTAELKRTFVNIKAPYEDNFQQTLSFASSTISDTGEGKGWSSGAYTCEVTAQATTDNKINVYFNLPYAVDENLVPVEADTDKVAQITVASQGAKDIDCFDWYVTSGKSHQNKNGGSPVFVKAPLILYTDVNNENTKQYFQYWKVTTQGGYGKSSTDITRCYDYEFNLSLFMDSIIEPVYGNTWGQTNNNPSPPTTYKMYERFDPELQFNTDTISIAFLENSRNQYNNNGNGGRRTSPVAADVIYIDFLLSFNKAYGTTQLNTITDSSKKAGVVVESVGYMDYETGSTIFDYDKDYSNVDSFTSNATSQATAISNWLTGSGDKPNGVAKSQFEVTALDNKNCLQYYCTLNNRAYSEAGGGQLLNTLQNRYKVFRAYAYIGDVNENNLTEVKLSDPVYFTIYDAGCQGLDDNANNNN